MSGVIVCSSLAFVFHCQHELKAASDSAMYNCSFVIIHLIISLRIFPNLCSVFTSETVSEILLHE